MDKYEIRPVRIKGRIVEWVLYCPNGAVLVATNFSQAIWLMNSQISKARLNSSYGKFASV
jgi:hypothetical protein